MSEAINIPTPLTVREVVDAVCARFGVTKELLFGRRNTKDVVQIRQLMYLLCDDLCSGRSRHEISKVLNRHHTTYLHGIRAAGQMIVEEPELGQVVASIKADLQQRKSVL